MKHIFISAVATVFLTACASSSNDPAAFGPAYGSDFGYRNTQIQNDRFRISYTSRDLYQSRDFALLRAAQIAENEGYSHFKVIGGEGFDNGPNRISTGLGVGFGGRRGFNRTNVGIGIDDLGRTLNGRIVTETIEVILLNTAPANDPNVFSAQSVIRNIVPYNLAQPAGSQNNGTAQAGTPYSVPPSVVTP